MLLSMPEGDDKPYKYPPMFIGADVVLISKADLEPMLDFNTGSFTGAVQGLNARAEIFKVSSKTGQGLEDWYSWLEGQLKNRGS